jgi:hypothetical protein
MKAYGGGCIDPRILDLSSSWREAVSFTTWPLYAQGKAHGTHWIGWVGPRTALDYKKRKILLLLELEL